MPSALEKALALAAQIAEKNGMSLNTNEILKHDEIQAEKEVAKRVHSNALELVINQLHHQHASMMKTCVWCKEPFMTNYCYHQFCSDTCRVAEFIDHFKVDPAKLQLAPSFYVYEEIGVVPVELTKKLVLWAQYIVNQFESLTDQEFESLPEGPEAPTIEQFQSSSQKSLQTQPEQSEEEDLSLPANLQNTLDSLDSLEVLF